MKLVRLLLLACICMMACRQQPQSNEVTNYDLPQMKDSGELVVLTLNSSTLISITGANPWDSNMNWPNSLPARLV